jgi:hypothetical protein
MDFLSAGFDQMTTYVSTKVTETYDDITKPIYTYFDENSKQIEKEERRQAFIERKKEMYRKNNDIRKRHGIITKQDMIKLINDSNCTCHVVFVNDDHATNKDEAIVWATKILTSGYLDSNLTEIKTTKVVKLKSDDNTELINEEFEAYSIVLYLDNSDIQVKFIVLDKAEFMKGDIKIKSRFNLKDNGFTDIFCKWKLFGMG